MKLNKLIYKAHKTAYEKGWWNKERSIGEIIALMHSELSEALEEARNLKLPIIPEQCIYFKEGKPEGLAIELADLLIRVFDFCGKYEIPLKKALKIKMKYNKTRPYRHGREF